MYLLFFFYLRDKDPIEEPTEESELEDNVSDEEEPTEAQRKAEEAAAAEAKKIEMVGKNLMFFFFC